MKEWFMENFDAAVIASLVSVVSSAVMGIIGLVSSARSRKDYNRLVAAIKARRTYTFCPRCKEKLYFEDLNWYVDGKQDQNLNGVPDDEE